MNARYTEKYRSLYPNEIYQIVCAIDPTISRFSYDYYKETNRKNNAGVTSLKACLLSMVHIDEAIKAGLIAIN